jgi:AcrR family transcriptional regulator
MEHGTAGSRERILKVAERVFAAQGFDRARVEEIARQAGVNKALI